MLVDLNKNKSIKHYVLIFENRFKVKEAASLTRYKATIVNAPSHTVQLSHSCLKRWYIQFGRTSCCYSYVLFRAIW